MSTIETVLKTVAPKADAAFLAATSRIDVAGMMKRHGLDGVNEQSQLIGHMAVECGGFRVFAENLNYTAKRLHEVWPSRFPSEHEAQPYAKNPKGLANKVYNGRMGNALGSDDGWNYRGSGGLQHTGKSEFDRVQRRTGKPVVSNPAMLRDPARAEEIWLGAITYFVDRGALAPAKAGDTLTTTKKINGGTNGLADRKTYVARAHAVIGGSPISSVPGQIETKIEVPAGPKTTTEVADDEKKKRDVAVGTGTVATGGSGGGSAAAKTDWVLVAGITIAVGLIAFLIIRGFWRRHAEAQANVERLQLAAITQRVGEPT